VMKKRILSPIRRDSSLHRERLPRRWAVRVARVAAGTLETFLARPGDPSDIDDHAAKRAINA
jgi:hypothetical protein